jgi:oxygen-dependent protoporphyrinogen oxidase
MISSAIFFACFPGLILAGNIRDGIGMADRVKQAKNIAEEIIR